MNKVYKMCSVCEGSGAYRHYLDTESMTPVFEPCSDCNGTGRIETEFFVGDKLDECTIPCCEETWLQKQIKKLHRDPAFEFEQALLAFEESLAKAQIQMPSEFAELVEK